MSCSGCSSSSGLTKLMEELEKFFQDFESQDSKVVANVCSGKNSETSSLDNKNSNAWEQYEADHKEEGDDASSSGKKEEDVYKDWNPIESMYAGVLNFGGVDDQLEDAFKYCGAEIPELNYCQFDNHQGGCFKGERCRKVHRVYDAHGRVVPPTPPDVISFSINDLPPQHVPGTSAIFSGQVLTAANPNDFHLLPEWDFDCDCRRNLKLKNMAVHRIHHAQNFKLGKYAHEDIHLSLKKFMMRVNRAQLQTKVYLRGELVVCDTRNTNNYGWTRGIVLRTTGVHDENNNEVPVFLIDFGEIILVPYNDLYIMTKQFTLTQPLVYRCALFGITSVGDNYSKRACEFFHRLLVQNNTPVNVTVIRVPDGSIGGETEPFVVDLRVKVDGKFQRVADILAHFGFAVQFNPLPFRPALFRNKILTMSDAIALEFTQKPEEDMNKLLARERERADSYWLRTDVYERLEAVRRRIRWRERKKDILANLDKGTKDFNLDDEFESPNFRKLRVDLMIEELYRLQAEAVEVDPICGKTALSSDERVKLLFKISDRNIPVSKLLSETDNNI